MSPIFCEKVKSCALEELSLNFIIKSVIFKKFGVKITLVLCPFLTSISLFYENLSCMDSNPTSLDAIPIIPVLCDKRAHQSNVFAAEFLPFNEEHLVSGGNDAEMKYYNLETEEGTIYSHHTRKVLRMTVHPDHSHSFMSCSSDGTVRMIDTRQVYGDSVSGPIQTVQGRNGDIVSQALGGGRGSILFGRGAREEIPAESSLVLNYRTRTSSPQLFCVDFNPSNGNQFIVSSEMGDVRLFDLRKIENRSPCSYVNIFTPKIGYNEEITGCAFSKDGQRVVLTALSDAIYTFDANFNFETEANFPLCFSSSPRTRRKEPCSHSSHHYSLSMLERFYQWKPSANVSANATPPSQLSSDEEEDENDEEEELEEEEEEEEEIDASVEEREAEENEEASEVGQDASEEAEAVPTARQRARRRRLNRNEEEEDDDEDLDIEAEADRLTQTLDQMLGAWPRLEDGGVIELDLATLLRAASAVNRARRRRNEEMRVRGGDARQPTHHTTPVSSSSSSAAPSTLTSPPPASSSATNSEENDASKNSPPNSSNQADANNTENGSLETLASPSAASSSDVESSPAEKEQEQSLKSKNTSDGESNADGRGEGQEVEKKQKNEEEEGDDEDSDPPKPHRSSPHGPNDSPGEEDRQKPEKDAKEPLNLPSLFLRRITGHSSSQTIKGVGFWGPQSEFVVSGSDDANTFIWEAETGVLVNILEGHDDVVNCVVGHPKLFMLATSGIDDIIKLWEASGPPPNAKALADRLERITRRNSAHRRQGHRIQCGTQ